MRLTKKVNKTHTKIMEDLAALIGKIAITETEMDPKGTITIDGEVYEAEAQDNYIEAGRGVRVVRVKGKRIIVKRV